MPQPVQPIAYRLTPVYAPNANSLVTACCMFCEATGEMLSGSGGGGEYVSPDFYARMKAGEFLRPPSAAAPPEASLEGAPG